MTLKGCYSLFLSGLSGQRKIALWAFHPGICAVRLVGSWVKAHGKVWGVGGFVSDSKVCAWKEDLYM